MTANLTIYVVREQNLLLLPNKAFSFKPVTNGSESLPQPSGEVPELKDKQRCVWAVRDNKLLPTAVTVGLSNGVNTQIISGLPDGAIVAVDYDSAMPDNQSEQNGERSPFAPQPPGRNKKK